MAECVKEVRMDEFEETIDCRDDSVTDSVETEVTGCERDETDGVVQLLLSKSEHLETASFSRLKYHRNVKKLIAMYEVNLMTLDKEILKFFADKLFYVSVCELFLVLLYWVYIGIIDRVSFSRGGALGSPPPPKYLFPPPKILRTN